MVSINQAIQSVKDDLHNLLDQQSIFKLCKTVGHPWGMGVLNPAVLIHLFVMQILNRNTACSHLRHLSGLSFTASAYCQARMRLPLRVIVLLVRQACQRLDHLCGHSSSLWHGHRVWRIDGSSFSMPDTLPLRKYFGQPSNQLEGCGFTVASFLARMHAGTGMLCDLIVGPLVANDISKVSLLHQRLQPNDVVVGDRGFASYAHLALVLQSKMHAVFRLHQRVKVSFQPNRPCTFDLPHNQRKGIPNSRWLRRIGKQDQLVTYFKPKSKPKWMIQTQYDAMPNQIVIPELCYQITRRGFRTRTVMLVSTLIDGDQYPKEELVQLYGDRWQMEVDLRSLKITLGMDVLHCKTVDGVLKELWMFVLVYNLVRLVMWQASQQQGVDVERISFVDALRWLHRATPNHALEDLQINPLRRDRVEPRVVKRRRKRYPLLGRPRHVLRQAILKSEVTP